jgi:hypothetical protein
MKEKKGRAEDDDLFCLRMTATVELWADRRGELHGVQSHVRAFFFYT